MIHDCAHVLTNAEYHEPVVELQASASLRSMVVPTVTLGAWADAAVASLSAIVFAKCVWLATAVLVYLRLQLPMVADVFFTSCFVMVQV